MTVNSPVKTKIVINGTDVTSYVAKWEFDVTYNKSYISGSAVDIIGRVSEIISVDVEDLFAIESSIEIYRGIDTADTILFKGVITRVDKTPMLVKLLCYDPLYLANKTKITYSFDKDIDPEAGVISDIFKNLINRVEGLVADSDSVQNSGTSLVISKFICRSETIFEKCKQLAELIGWIFYYSPVTEKVHFQPKGFINNTYNINTKTNVTKPLVWSSNEQGIYNSIEIQGAEQEVSTKESGQIGTTPGYTTTDIQLNYTPVIVKVLSGSTSPPTTERPIGVIGKDTTFSAYVDTFKNKIIWNTSLYTPGATDYVIVEYTYMKPVPVLYSDIESIEKYGLKETTIFDSGIKEVDDAQLYAIEFIGDRKDPIKTTNASVIEIPDLSVGQQILVTDDAENINDFYFITRIQKRHPYAPDVVTLVSNIPEDENYIVLIANKLRELDRRGKTDFSSLIHIYSLINNVIYENEYFEIYKNAVKVYRDYNYQTYVEWFLTTDLRNSSSTGNWITGLGYSYLFETQNLISEIFTLCNYSSTNNYYLKADIILEGAYLENLKLYIGENDNSTINYTEVSLTGTNKKKTGNLLLSNTNKYGLCWKAINDPDTPLPTVYTTVLDNLTGEGTDALPEDGTFSLAFSKDSNYLFVSGEDKVYIYKKNDNEFNLYQEIEMPSNTYKVDYISINFADNIIAIFYKLSSGTNPHRIVFIKKAEDVFYLQSPPTVYTGGTGNPKAQFSNTSNKFFLATLDKFYLCESNINNYSIIQEMNTSFGSSGQTVKVIWEKEDSFFIYTNGYIGGYDTGYKYYKKNGATYEYIPTAFSLDNGTASSGSSTTLVDSTKSWVTDEFAGQRVAVYEGTGTGNNTRIVSNNATTLTVTATDGAFNTWAAIDATSKYIILDLPVDEEGVTPSYCDIEVYECALSNDGTYFIGTMSLDVYGGTNRHRIAVYKKDGDKFTQISHTITNPTGFNTYRSIKFSPDDKYLFIFLATSVLIYELNKLTDTFTLLNSTDILDNSTFYSTAGLGVYCDFSNDMKYLGVTERNLTTPPTKGGLRVFSRNVINIDKLQIKYEVNE